jgi:hypothetical protein
MYTAGTSATQQTSSLHTLSAVFCTRCLGVPAAGSLEPQACTAPCVRRRQRFRTTRLQVQTALAVCCYPPSSVDACRGGVPHRTLRSTSFCNASAWQLSFSERCCSSTSIAELRRCQRWWRRGALARHRIDAPGGVMVAVAGGVGADWCHVLAHGNSRHGSVPVAMHAVCEARLIHCFGSSLRRSPVPWRSCAACVVHHRTHSRRLDGRRVSSLAPHGTCACDSCVHCVRQLSFTVAVLLLAHPCNCVVTCHRLLALCVVIAGYSGCCTQRPA